MAGICSPSKFSLRFYTNVIVLLLAFSAQLSFAKELEMAFSKDIPPYIFQQQNKGIEIDIISAALAHKGHTLNPLYFPLGRIPLAFQERQVDAVMGDMGVDLLPSQGVYAEPGIVYDNVFITLQRRGLSIKKPSDLDGLTVVSFQGAEKRYPEWLSKVVKEKRFYGVSDQLMQVKLLNLQRYDVVLSDKYIFQYFVKLMNKEGKVRASATNEHHFVEVNPQDYRPVFRDEQIRNDFNEGFNMLKDSGKFQAIYNHYLN